MTELTTNPFAGLIAPAAPEPVLAPPPMPAPVLAAIRRREKIRRVTERENQVLAFMKKFHREQDQTPPEAYIAKHFGWASANAAHEILIRLELKGEIERNVIGKWRFARKKGGAK